MSFWDDNDLEEISEENLRYFYEEFSASVRKQLLNKNLMVPQNVYDVLYPRTKEALLARNVPKITDLEEDSKSIRDALVAKLVSEHTDLEKLSEDTRKSLLARNEIIQEANDLLNASYYARKNILSKNVSESGDLLKDSEDARRNNLNKNNENVSTQTNLDTNSADFRDNNLSKNKPTESNLESDSAQFRKNSISKNTTEVNKELDEESKEFRKNNLSKNKDTNSANLESIGEVQRFNNEIKNPSIDNTIDKTLENSEVFRDNLLSKNEPGDISIDTSADVIREKNLSSNVSNNSDLLADSDVIRRKNESANKPKNTDLESSSDSFRDSNVSKNTPKESDLESDSDEIRQNNISSNKPSITDLESSSIVYRDNNLSNNDTKEGNLESDSQEFRKNNLSPNKSNNQDLLSDSDVYLKNNISANKSNEGDLLLDSEQYLQNNVSANKPVDGDLLSDSADYYRNNTSANKPTEGDLLSDSEKTRQNNVSANKPNNSDLISDSEQFLENNVSANKPNENDLLLDSETYFQNNTSANKPSESDLLLDSEPYFQNNTALNVPNNSDLLLDSEQYFENNTAPNVPNNSDLLLDSEQFLDNNLAANVPGQSDLLEDSGQFLDNNLSSNVPSNSDLLTDSQNYLQDNIAPNVPSGGDLLTDSQTFLQDNISSNVPNGNDLLADSLPIRNNLIASNAPTNLTLDAISGRFRENNLAANPPIDPLGVVIEGIGTSTFLGISRVLTQGIILRQVLLSKNKPGKYTLDNFFNIATLEPTNIADAKNALISKNEFQIGKTEYTQFSANLVIGDGPGYYGNTVRELIQSQLNDFQYYNNSTALNLQDKYGTNSVNTSSPASVGGGFYSLDVVGAKGGWFNETNAVEKVNFDIRYNRGSITDAIRNYNLSRNLYNLYKLVPGDLQSLTTLQQNNDEGFQDLLAKTIGNLRGNDSVGSQLQGNLVPRGILVANEGAYIKGGSPENILRPQQAQGMVIGSPESMMAKTALGNPLNDEEFQAGRKGVRHIMRTIKNSDASKFTINYDVQNARKYIIGVNADGSPKFARQRFTVANPYKPGNAKTLLLYIQNYSSGQGFYFPPYIQSYSDSYGANWNTTNFLGRPEAVYTYNNSSREGTISFVVLTDYTQNLVIGRNFNDDSMSDVKINPRGHFTSKDVTQNKAKDLAFNEAEAQQQEVNNTKKEYNSYKNITNSGASESVLQQDIDDLQKQSNSMQKSQEDALIESNKINVYSETNGVIGNVNNFMTTKPDRDAGDIDTKAEDSKKRIDEMIRNLAFQPAFFSGDKVDFVTKMEFLAKLTRPATADEGSGFSFTRPPVCHIHMGDWWNNDIIVDSVSFNYDDVPWTLDEGRVQPMWAVVNINFKFVGPYRGQQGPPVLSDDEGGFYQDIKRAPKPEKNTDNATKDINTGINATNNQTNQR